jgi:hypothetical protein
VLENGIDKACEKSVPKDVTTYRFEREFSEKASPETVRQIERMCETLSDHEIDAIMLAVFWLCQRYIPRVKHSRKKLVIPRKA